MHTYQRLRAADDVGPLPDIEAYRFTDAHHVEAWAAHDPTIGWRTWPEVWHLDGSGRFLCWFKGESVESIRWWADHPENLHRSRRAGLADGGCPANWLILDSRPRVLNPPPVVDESDAAAFLHLRRDLESIGVTLVDAVVIDDECHWWSLHELTTGTTTWTMSSDR